MLFVTCAPGDVHYLVAAARRKRYVAVELLRALTFTVGILPCKPCRRKALEKGGRHWRKEKGRRGTVQMPSLPLPKLLPNRHQHLRHVVIPHVNTPHHVDKELEEVCAATDVVDPVRMVGKVLEWVASSV